MTRLLRFSALAPLLAAGSSLLLLAVGLFTLWRHDSPRDTSGTASSAATVSPGFAVRSSQPAESAAYPVEFLEPHRLELPDDVIPAAFVFGPPQVENADASIATPHTVAPSRDAPWQGRINVSPPLPGPPTIAPPANATPRRLPPAGTETNEVQIDDAASGTSNAPPRETGFRHDELPGDDLEPRRLPPVDEPAPQLPTKDASLFRLPASVDDGSQYVPSLQERETKSPSGDDDTRFRESTFEPSRFAPSPAPSPAPHLGPDFPSAATPEIAPRGGLRYPDSPEGTPRLRRLPEVPSQVFAPCPPGSQHQGITPTNPPVPPPQQDMTTPSRRLAFDPALAAVSRQAMEMVQYGFSLAHRGADFSARAQFIQSLRTIAQALDAAEGTDAHSVSLAEGLRALEEADDFVPRGSRLEADMDLDSVIASHRTTVLKGEPTPTALEALQRYYTYAQQRLASAGGGMPASSMALYALGKLHTAAPDQTPQERRLNDPKALALHHAALLVDSRNYEAANELGVLLARYGELQDARGVLLHGLSMHATASLWHNLAVVHERLGEIDLARRARHEQQLAERQSPDNPLAAAVQWVPPEEFARTSQAADPSLSVPTDSR